MEALRENQAVGANRVSIGMCMEVLRENQKIVRVWWVGTFLTLYGGGGGKHGCSHFISILWGGWVDELMWLRKWGEQK